MNANIAGNIKLLLVEDSHADSDLIMEVLADEKLLVDIEVVRDGEEALEYLLKKGKYSQVVTPDLIFLDLNLPRKDGRELLAEIKGIDNLKSIPVVILTTSQAEKDIAQSYKLQAACYVTKPMRLEEFVRIVKTIEEFWFTIVRFPKNHEFRREHYLM